MVVTLLKKRSAQGNSGFKFQLGSNLMLLRILNRVNVEKDLIMDYEDFYVPEVNDLINLPDAYYRWLMEKSQSGGAMSTSSEFHICDFPFVFDATAKTKLLEVRRGCLLPLA